MRQARTPCRAHAHSLSRRPFPVQFPALVEERAGDPDKQQDERVSDDAWKEPEENGQERQQHAHYHCDACFDRFDHTPVGERSTNDIGTADRSGSGTPGASAAASQHRTLMTWLIRRAHFSPVVENNLRGVVEVCEEHRFHRLRERFVFDNNIDLAVIAICF